MLTTTLLLAFAASGGDGAPAFTQDEWLVLRSMSPAVLIPDTTNAYEKNEHAALLGQHIFLTNAFHPTRKYLVQLVMSQINISPMVNKLQLALGKQLVTPPLS